MAYNLRITPEQYAAHQKRVGQKTVSFGTIHPPKPPTLPDGEPVKAPRRKKALAATKKPQ